LTAVVEKVKKDNLGEDTVGVYLNAKQLGQEALQTLREATLLRTDAYKADRVANLGLHLLRERYTPNNMPTKFLVSTSSPMKISWTD
jgi:hypothetical protein